MIKQYLYAAIMVALLFAGWQARSWYEDSKDLAAEQARQDLISVVRNKESGIAAEVEKRLQELKANERVIENHTKEIINRPIYVRECIDDDGLRIINSYALNHTAELIGEMSRNAARSDR